MSWFVAAGNWGAWATRECSVTMGNGVFEQEYWHVGDEADDDEVPPHQSYRQIHALIQFPK